jgi:curved DNA-binding protein CbpA
LIAVQTPAERAMARSFYEVLELPPYASLEEIKEAYRVLAKKYHPDLNRTVSAAQRFRQINEAYKILSDIKARRAYDASLKEQTADDGQLNTISDLLSLISSLGIIGSLPIILVAGLTLKFAAPPFDFIIGGLFGLIIAYAIYKDFKKSSLGFIRSLSVMGSFSITTVAVLIVKHATPPFDFIIGGLFGLIIAYAIYKDFNK